MNNQFGKIDGKRNALSGGNQILLVNSSYGKQSQSERRDGLNLDCKQFPEVGGSELEYSTLLKEFRGDGPESHRLN